MDNNLLWKILLDHFGHDVEIAKYGDPDNPVCVCLEDMDTGAVILDAELYTLTGRTDVDAGNTPAETKDPDLARQAEHYRDMFVRYVQNDLEAADPEYVVEALRQAGADDEEIRDLGFEDLLEEEA